MNISFIIPTIGRDTLRNTLDSLELRPHDEVLVVGDGMQPNAGLICRDRAQVYYYEVGPYRDWGHSLRNWGMRRARSTHLAFIDDDDTYVSGYRALFEDAGEHDLMMFRMKSEKVGVVWRHPLLQEGNVGTPMGLVPNVPTYLGKWGHRYEGDFDFYASCNFPIVWRSEVIVHAH